MRVTASGDDTEQVGVELLPKAQNYLRARANGYPPTGADSDAWHRFYQWCDALVRRFVRGHGVHGEALEDCIQEAWLVLVVRLRRLEYDPQRGRLHTWLYTVVRGVAIDHIRRTQRGQTGRLVVDLPAPDEHAIRQRAEEATAQAQRIMQLAKRTMSRDSYEVVRLRCERNEPVAQVAAETGLTREQVWFRLHRARRKLRRLWQEQCV